MNRINNTDEGVARRARLTNELVNNERKWLFPGRYQERSLRICVRPGAE
jgi:hypothetical protein